MYMIDKFRGFKYYDKKFEIDRTILTSLNNDKS